MACGLRELLSSTNTLDTSRLRLTKTHEIEDDGPLLRRTSEDVIVEALEVDDDDENELDEDQGSDPNKRRLETDAEDAEIIKRAAERTREERLRHDLYVLKKLNSAFFTFNDALKETKSGTEVCPFPQDLPIDIGCRVD